MDYGVFLVPVLAYICLLTMLDEMWVYPEKANENDIDNDIENGNHNDNDNEDENNNNNHNNN